jgi:Peptidase family M48
MRTYLPALMVVAAVGCGNEKRAQRSGNAEPTMGPPPSGPVASKRGAARPVPLVFPPVVTDGDLKSRGDEMRKALVDNYKPGPAGYRRNFQTACRIINQAFAAKGVDLARVRCEVINHPAFNANTLPGGHIVATTTLVAGYTNLAAAQVLYQKSIKDYLSYNDSLAKAIAQKTPPAKLPLPACLGGGDKCFAAVLSNPLFAARVAGLLTAVAAHEYGHVRAGHVLNEFLRKNVEQFNSRAFASMTGKQVDSLFKKLQGVAMNHVDEYQADEMAAKYLAICYAHTNGKYSARLKDKLAGPHPMDAFYTLWFLMSLDKAHQAAGRDTPAFQKNHPPARLRAQRVLQVIIRNKLPSHELAKAAYGILFGKKK